MLAAIQDILIMYYNHYNLQLTTPSLEECKNFTSSSWVKKSLNLSILKRKYPYSWLPFLSLFPINFLGLKTENICNLKTSIWIG